MNYRTGYDDFYDKALEIEKIMVLENSIPIATLVSDIVMR